MISAITLALRPRPAPAVTVAGLFPSCTSAAAAVAKVVASGLRPSLLEFLDRVTLSVVGKQMNMGLETAEAMLIAQSDAPGAQSRADAKSIEEIFWSTSATEVIIGDDPEEAELLLAARRLANPALKTLGITLTDDVCIPRDCLAPFVEEVALISQNCGLTIAILGHAGDGNIHTTIVYDEATTSLAMQTSQKIGELALRLHGTITGEHGVGALKVDLLALEIGPTSLELHNGIKMLFDPDAILNPGKVLRGSIAR